jgi:hypothetical protein
LPELTSVLIPQIRFDHCIRCLLHHSGAAKKQGGRRLAALLFARWG